LRGSLRKMRGSGMDVGGELVGRSSISLYEGGEVVGEGAEGVGAGGKDLGGRVRGLCMPWNVTPLDGSCVRRVDSAVSGITCVRFAHSEV
jgi:hypothetical protein